MDVVPITESKLSWLAQQSARWRDAGLIDDQTKARILEGYEVRPYVRGTLLLLIFALLAFAAGVLLLIGYNWHRIPATAKIGIILTAVAASFAGSAFSYARKRDVQGEALAAFGTLLYGNGIWLIAQVLNIGGYFPDAFFWFGVGAAACAFLVRSAWIGIGAAVLTVIWAFASAAASPRPEYWFPVVWPVVILLAYRLQSALMLAIAAFAAPLWAFATALQLSRRPLFLGAAALTGCALYAIGDWHRSDVRMKRAWQVAGLFPLVLTMIPLLVTEVHRDGARALNATPAVLFAMIAIAGVTAMTLLRRKPRDAATAAVSVTVVALLVWTALMAGGAITATLAVLAVTILFSIVALVLSASFIRTALCTSDTSEFGFGILFAVVFIAVRWTSVIQNMFLSGVIMISTGAALLFVARLWRRRDHTMPLRGRVS